MCSEYELVPDYPLLVRNANLSLTSQFDESITKSISSENRLIELPAGWPPIDWENDVRPIDCSVEAIKQWFDWALDFGALGMDVFTQSNFNNVAVGLRGSDFVRDAYRLVEVLAQHGFCDPPNEPRGESSPHVAVVELREVKRWIDSQQPSTGDEKAPAGEVGESLTDRMSWQEAAKRMEQLREQGEPFTSQHKLAKSLGCSSGTINRAIKETPSLTTWARREVPSSAKAQSLNDVVTDKAVQRTELDPADDAAIREYLEREDITPDERAFFHGLSTNDQLDFLDDPGKHDRILDRKP